MSGPGWRLIFFAAVLAIGCGKGATSSSTSAPTSAGATAASTTGVATTSTGSGGTQTTVGSSGSTTEGSSGGTSVGTSASSTTNNGAGSTGSSDCVPDGSFVDPSSGLVCCSGELGSSGYCESASTGGPTTGTTAATTNGTTTTAASTGGAGTTGTAGVGSWSPPDAGYQEPMIGDGGGTVEIGGGADATSPGKFGGAATGSAPTMVYPPDGVVVPPNMNSLEFHFIPAPGQTLFRFTFHAPTTTLEVFTGCTPLNGGCVYTPDATFWNSLVDFARGTAPVTYTLSGVNGPSPGSVGTSPTRSIAFSDQDITSGIYFWNTSGVVERYDWGLPGSPSETWMDPRTAGATFCVGCHVLSRDGALGVVGKDIPSPASFGVFEVSSRLPDTTSTGQALTGSADFFSFSPNGELLLTSDGITVSEKDLTSGVTTPRVIASGTMPDWSPDGSKMVFSKPRSAPFFGVPGVSDGALELSNYNGAGWDPATSLVPFSGQNNYYPSFAPTGDWVAFNRSPSDEESFSNAAPDPDAGTVPDGELWTVSASGGNALRLDQASNPGALSWPKWAPVVSDYYGGKLMWLTFSSARAYGLRLAQGQQTQLWMVGFDPALAAAGQDPSTPAFYLPFQDASGDNHIAQWVTSVVRQACTQNSDCPTKDQCSNGRCVPIVITNIPGR